MHTRDGRKATIYDIATATGASATTVSLVLNGSWTRYRIKPATAERILAAAGLLGYNVNLNARGLRLSRSGLAGMILPHYRNRFFADLAEAFEAEARTRELCPIVVSTQRDKSIEAQVTRTLLAQRVEFLFVAGVPEPGPLNRLCAEAHVPCVNLDLPGPGAPSVTSDNRAGARRLAAALVAKLAARGKGLDGFMYIGGVAGEFATDQRVAGFTEALQAAGTSPAPGMLALCGYPPANAREVLLGYLARHRRLPDALFINSIAAFEGVVEVTSGLPGTLLEALIAGCFDWDPFAAHLPFDVTMLRQDTETMMREAFAALAPGERESGAMVVVPPILVQPRRA